MEIDIRFRMRYAMPGESYIRDLTATIQGRIQDAKQKTLRDNHEADIIKSEAPKQWMELKTWLREAVAQVNVGLPSAALHYKEETLDEVEIRCVTEGDARAVAVTFRPMIGQIYAKGNVSKEAFDAKVEGNKLTFIEDVMPNARVSVERMGTRILDMAVKS